MEDNFFNDMSIDEMKRYIKFNAMIHLRPGVYTRDDTEDGEDRRLEIEMSKDEPKRVTIVSRLGYWDGWFIVLEEDREIWKVEFDLKEGDDENKARDLLIKLCTQFKNYKEYTYKGYFCVDEEE